MMLERPTLHDKLFGAYIMLYAGFSKRLFFENTGYLMPWGRVKVEKVSAKRHYKGYEG